MRFINAARATFLAIVALGSMNSIKSQTKNEKNMNTIEIVDNSKKRILARGCDPQLTQSFGKMISPQIGNPEYVGVSNDVEFLEKLKTEQWSVIYFAPGACRFSDAKMPIPGGNMDTQGWTLEDYKKVIIEYQSEDIQIAESLYESESLNELVKALTKSKNVK
ncbi:MAG: hypothetical protein N4A46_12855 [Schleiferiaceae bacterium]|nr:hypothetical protein [Schleiferiaceae bacterium]